jgi:ribosomal protein S18 acetylase RimI-like enzyme
LSVQAPFVQSALSASVRPARLDDVNALVELVNQAYAVEAFFVAGERTSADELVKLYPQFVVLEHARGLAAAVYVEERGYFGMLSVRPELQGLGLGKRLVGIAEGMCEAAGANQMALRVINLREELPRWYRSLGYREVGTTPYTNRRVLKACHFIEMTKPLGMRAAA